MEVKDFYYNLPEELIAQVPIKKRDESRLMVLDRENKTIEHKVFKFLSVIIVLSFNICELKLAISLILSILLIILSNFL